ncbi:MAG: hypothetical protein ACRDXC_01270 [Acidimicrobiales bacterium]
MVPCFAMVLSAFVVSASGAAAGTPPTLGVKRASTNWGAGFGAVRPSAISFNGDPTSFISKVHWSSWGGHQAIGRGIAGFEWPGFAVADGTRYVKATVVAFDRGTCDGHSAYQREEWYFPQYGETFAPAFARLNLCTGKVVGHTFPDSPVNCPKDQFTTWVSGGLKCRELSGVEDLVDGTAHRGHSARWISHGWICGTDLSMGRNPQTVTCQRGNSEGVSFAI